MDCKKEKRKQSYCMLKWRDVLALSRTLHSLRARRMSVKLKAVIQADVQPIFIPEYLLEKTTGPITTNFCRDAYETVLRGIGEGFF